ncbi:MAG: sulfite exporter TauE/SafE family protein [Alphaproteobacteria bacterium]|nr:sulfite exporter TauE/SafE family protein [Alphaproteobacteria bacterium]
MTLFVALIIAFGFFVQATMGFGAALISVSILSIFFPIADMVTLVLVFQFMSAGLLTIANRKDVEWRRVFSLMPLTVVGLVFGVLCLKYVNEDYVRIFLAGYILLYLLSARFALNVFKLIVDKSGIHGTGFMGGSLMGLIGMGGPPYAIYLKENTKTHTKFRADLLAIFLVVNIIRLPLSFSIDVASEAIWMMALYTAPFFLFAIWAGHKLHVRIPESIFKIGIDLLLFGSALSLLTKVLL